MKFTGLIASLAVASSASALAIPQTPVAAALSKLNGALNNVEGLVGGLLSGVCHEVDLTQVQTELVEIKGQLTKLVPVSVPTKRDTMGTVEDVVKPVTYVAGGAVGTIKGAVGTVKGAVEPVTNVADTTVGTVKNTAGDVVGTVQKTASGPVDTVTDTVGVKRQEVGQLTVLAQSMVSKVKSGALDAAGLENILNIVGQSGGLSSITSILTVLQQ